MEKNRKNKHKSSQKPKVTDFDGLKVNYDTNGLAKQYPHLMSEISNKKKTMKIDSVNINIESKMKNLKLQKTEDYEEDLKSPCIIDFLRRCKNKEEAFEILDYLYKRKEVNPKFYKILKDRIKKKGGLKKVIEECGGPKEPGYYERKYYSKKV